MWKTSVRNDVEMESSNVLKGSRNERQKKEWKEDIHAVIDKLIIHCRII